MRERYKLRVKGVVQGVGFRPFVYNLATHLNLGGFVLNDPFGVVIEVEGEVETLRRFLKDLREKVPPASFIEGIEKKKLPPQQEREFIIKKSVPGEDKFVFISYDLSVCEACLRELFDPKDRRFLYPFINCTNCGPRYTIIKDIPYDRKNTTMKNFLMCKRCDSEYHNPQDRRFHAQPNACFVCGPTLKLVEKRDTKFLKLGREKLVTLLREVAGLIHKGKIVAIKGIGGYHIACDATNQETVTFLRERKRRPTKPFAIMVDDIKVISKLCFINKKERQLLSSPKRPILLLRIKQRADWMQTVAPFQKFLGVMLAYAPLHYLVFWYLREFRKEPILIMTSANLKDLPLAKDEGEIFSLGDFVDYFLIHNRPIYLRCDDSVSRVYNNKEYIIRKARGYIPDFFGFPSSKAILGCGAELKSTFSITKNNWLITSQYLGDLKNYSNYEFFLDTLTHFKSIFNFEPQIVAYDYHPNYLSTQYALSLKDKVKIPIQHHHAHAAACMLENRLEEEVVGVIFDGIGFGQDQKVWGGEFLICDLKRFKRVAYFDYFGLIGIDKAIEEPFRVTFYILYQLFGKSAFSLDLDFVKDIPISTLKLFISLIKAKKFILTSSAGRLFDALASLLRLKDSITYEAEAAILLEMVALDFRGRVNPYPFKLEGQKVLKIKWQPIFYQIVKDLIDGRSNSYIAYRFHYTLACIIREVCVKIRKQNQLSKVVLSGGVFQNWLLLTLTTRILRQEQFLVYVHSRFPCNDACISVGQVAIATNITK
jgi:hydrogenase maturation protein HypF